MDVNNINSYEINNCPCCGKQADVVQDLPSYPITEFFTENINNKSLEGFYDQTLLFCDSCQHLFLKYILDPKIIYNNYLTTSNSSKGAIDCLIDLKSFISKNINTNHFDTIVDFGGNDSSFLSFYEKSHDNLINVDLNASSKSKKINLIKKSLEDFDPLSIENFNSKLIISSHTIEHVKSPSLFIEKISKCMKDDDVLFLQFPSLELLVGDLTFDQICHQHLNIFSLKSIEILLNSFGLYIQNHEFDSKHFGTLRLKISRKKNKYVHISNLDFVEIKDALKIFKNYYNELNESLSKNIKSSCGFGAGLMVPTLSYFLPIINDLDFIYDQNPSRTNKRFVNMSPIIIDGQQMDINKNFIITAISTKIATRQILNYLLNKKVTSIIIPKIYV